MRNMPIHMAMVAALAIGAAPAWAADKVPAYIAAAVADAARPDSDRSRDAARKPAETIAFVGVKPGDRVGELLTGAGYFTRILSRVVGPKGHIYAVNTQPRDVTPAQALAANPAYSNVSSVVTPLADMKIAEPLDVVWTTQNYHDLHNQPGADMAPINKAAFDALKPGGIYFVLDHVAQQGATFEQMRTAHRIDPAIVKREVLAAGFVLAGESDVLRNTTDTHIEPSHDASQHDKTDQFALKFRKPG